MTITPTGVTVPKTGTMANDVTVNVTAGTMNEADFSSKLGAAVSEDVKKKVIAELKAKNANFFKP